ncbi:centrosomal protein of 76 kDa-like [Tubulanus polymorphus]|uniref:centrosomal protein of 76 kDa-like n=1 Tax=Tubulanus polymorphus TaxID=672921 RepID=UPI003DA4FC9E
MPLRPEKVAELRQIVHEQLAQLDIQSCVRELLPEREESNNGVSEADLYNALNRKGIVDEIMSKLHLGDEQKENREQKNQISGQRVGKDERTGIKKSNIDSTRRYLYLQIVGGRAFLEHLQEPESYPGGNFSATFTLHIQFRGQRFTSRPVPCACDPDIQETFILELHKEMAGDAARMADTTTMLSLCDPIHIVLIKTDMLGDTTLLSSHYLEWRTVLTCRDSRMNTAIELKGVGTESKVPIGMLEVKLELLPKTEKLLTEDVVSTQISLERGKQAEKERLFLVYAKQWWKEFLQIRDSHSLRLVKIFAQDECGTNRPVCSYVKPLRAGRLLDTPRHASRFVSLIGYERVPTVGGGRSEQWTSMHASLCRNKGDSEDHAVLLCSLLLGFGLDAYVCVGTKAKGVPHSWVMTRAPDGLTTFWECLTGHRYVHQPINPNDPPSVPQPKPEYPYRTIGCVFNHKNFYANSQPSDAVEICQFHLTEESLWKAMSEDAIKSVCISGAAPSWPTLPPLAAPKLGSAVLSNDLEQELRVLVSQHRRDQGLNTVWEDHLSYLLTPALSAYEMERISGMSIGNEEFQQAIRRAVPDGHTFKGYPIQFVHRNSRKAFAACLRAPVCEEIINCRGDHVKLAVRVRVFTYPESVCATWVMFACKYKSVL